MTTLAPSRPEDAAVPRSRAEIEAMAAVRELLIPEACRPGVEANLELLENHVRRMRGEDGA